MSRSRMATDSLHWQPEALDYCTRLPKVELHAHLNGSVRDETIRALVATHGLSHGLSVEDVDNITSKRQRTLDDCFVLFALIHKCTTTLDSVRRITQEVIHDFAIDNVLYLELRTTPKNRPESGITKASYVQAVLQGMQEAVEAEQAAGRWIMVRLLLSIDRREGPEDAVETVRLAASLQSQGVIGIDLSGNPRVGQWSQWQAALTEARAAGLAITLHAGEVPAEQEVSDMLHFQPERLGHMCCLSPESEQQLLASNIPVELCLTSNIKTSTFNGYPDHHFLGLHSARHPVVLCTDDSGVFGTTLSQEYAIAMTVFNLTRAQMQELAMNAVDYTFLKDEEKQLLRNRMQEQLEKLQAASEAGCEAPV